MIHIEVWYFKMKLNFFLRWVAYQLIYIISIFVLMKSILHKIVSIAMALLLLLSTMSWKVEKHYCMGRLMDVTLFSDVQSCGMETEALNVLNNNNLNETEKSCCEEQIAFVEGQNHLKVSLDDLQNSASVFLIAYTYTSLQLYADLFELPTTFDEYPPPLLVKNIHLLDEVFLI